MRLSRLLRPRRLSSKLLRTRLPPRRFLPPRRPAISKYSTTLRSPAIQSDRDGRVTGVLYRRNNEDYFQPAKVVFIGAYVYENVRLLLLSKSERYPNGLANNHGQVGRHYFGHQMGAVTALFPFDLNTWYGAIAQGVVIDEWADDNFDHSGPWLHRRSEPARLS